MPPAKRVGRFALTYPSPITVSILDRFSGTALEVELYAGETMAHTHRGGRPAGQNGLFKGGKPVFGGATAGQMMRLFKMSYNQAYRWAREQRV